MDERKIEILPRAVQTNTNRKHDGERLESLSGVYRSQTSTGDRNGAEFDNRPLYMSADLNRAPLNRPLVPATVKSGG
jgi:hypothetical protein